MTADRKPSPIATRIDLVLGSERASATRAARVHARGNEPLPAERRSDGDARLTLDETQRWFQAVVTHPGGIAAGAMAASAMALGANADGVPRALEVESVIADGAQIRATEALEIYAYAYRARLVECLADDYPALAYALGEEEFEAFAADYIEHHPSSSPNLNGFGRHMAAFCLESGRATFMADLARLEWSLVEVIHAQDTAPISAESLAAIPPDRFPEVRIMTSDALRLLRSDHDVNAFYRAFKEGDSPPWPEPRRAAIAVYRSGFTLWRMDLTPAMAELLDDLAGGTPLGTALENMAGAIDDPEELEEAERNVFAWFQSWVACGFFRAIVVPGEAA